jgi:hypothetical protein
VAVQNTSAITITVTPTLYVEEKSYRLVALQLQPHEMRLIHLRHELGQLGLGPASEGGIQLESSIPGAVVAGGALVSPAIGFSSELRLGDPRLEAERVRRLAEGRTLHALNVPIGAAPPEMELPAGTVLTPIMVLRNITGASVRVHPLFRYQIGDSQRSFALPDMELRPQQTERVELLSYWQSGQIPQPVNRGSLEIRYEGSVGPLVAAVTSVDQTGTYVLDARMDNMMGDGFQGIYWSLEGENHALVVIKNITRSPTTVGLSLQYNRGQGSYQMESITLQPSETRVMDLKQLQVEGVPDVHGEVLPVWATYGGLKLVEEPGGRHVLLELAIFNPRTATCGGCGQACTYPTSLITIPGAAQVIVGQFTAGVQVQARMCDGTMAGHYECLCEYTSDNSGIATINPDCTQRAYGVSPGLTDVWGLGTVPGPNCSEVLMRTTPCHVTVQKPDRIKVISDTGQGIIPTCSNGAQVIDRFIKYQVIDTTGTNITQGLSVFEDVYIASNTCSGTPISGQGTYASGGQFTDHVSIQCNSKCTSSSTCRLHASQDWVAAPTTVIASGIDLDVECFVSHVQGSLKLSAGTIMPK